MQNALGLGHLENDEKRLSDKLSESPGLAQPIVEAQVKILGLLHNPYPISCFGLYRVSMQARIQVFD